MRQEIDKNNAIGYTFGRRIQRPDYQSLNPFWYFLDLYTKYAGNFLTGRFDRQLTTFFVNANNTFTLGKTWSVEMTGYYQHNFLFGTFEIKPQAMVAVGIQKSFWERKGTFKFNVSDIFLTQRSNLAVNYQNVDMDMRRRLDSRYATLSFNYRFGNSKVAPARRRNSGADDENRRVRVQES